MTVVFLFAGIMAGAMAALMAAALGGPPMSFALAYVAGGTSGLLLSAWAVGRRR